MIIRIRIDLKGSDYLKKISIFKILFTALIFLFSFLLIFKAQLCQKAVANAIILCGKVLIPSLFPFSVCVFFIMQLKIEEKLKFLKKFTRKTFKTDIDGFLIFIFSLIGGYPIGAKLLNEACEENKLSAKNGGKMLNFCINAGPAFIVSAIGTGILRSKKLGFILLFSHILSSFIIFLFYRLRNTDFAFSKTTKKSSPNIADIFVLAVTKSSGVALNICSFVILFSAVTAYIEFYSQKIQFLKPVLFLIEVTFSVTKTNNIYLISFLLGFGGICVWFQIFSLTKTLRINPLVFSLIRIIHGLLSSILTYSILKIFPINIPVFSNNRFILFTSSVSSTELSIALLVLSSVFLISLTNRQKNTKILEELI